MSQRYENILETIGRTPVIKINKLGPAGINPYANGFTASQTTTQIADLFAGKPKEDIEACEDMFSIAGRVVSLRDFGKAAFVQIQDRSGSMQE